MPDDWDFSAKKRGAAPSQPIITYGLCVLCVLVTIAFLNQGASPVFARIAQVAAPTPERIWDGAYYALLTTFFVHGDLGHILFNMMVFVQLGRSMELTLPPWAYILFIAAAAAVSAGCELAITGIRGVGASGAIYAMFGLMWAGRSRYASWRAIATQRNLNMFLMWGVFCIIGTVAGFMHIANVEHFSGLLFGLSAGWLFCASPRRTVWAAPFALLIVLTVWSLFGTPWCAAWYTYRAEKAHEAQHYRDAIGLYHRSLRLGGDRFVNWGLIGLAWYQTAVEANQRGDDLATREALRQMASAQKLQGPNPARQRAEPASPSFHIPGRN